MPLTSHRGGRAPPTRPARCGTHFPSRSLPSCSVASFRGTFDFTLDAKNRLTIPSRYRASFADGITLAAGVERCVGVWPTADYDAFVSAALAGKSPLGAEYRKLERYFSSNVEALELDGAGRVMVPARLAEHAQLGREVSLVGAHTSLELWDRATWASYSEDLSENIEQIAAGFGG